jgi:hypothetical protein
MAKVMHNPSIAELLEAIKLEDQGVTYKVTAKDINKLPEVKSCRFFRNCVRIQKLS